jgi:uncharacterized DUF497 family protein
VDDVEWDPRKATANLKKHNVDFADAASVLYDDRAVTIRDDEVGEERYVTARNGCTRTHPGCRVPVARRSAASDLGP